MDIFRLFHSLHAIQASCFMFHIDLFNIFCSVHAAYNQGPEKSIDSMNMQLVLYKIEEQKTGRSIAQT